MTWASMLRAQPEAVTAGLEGNDNAFDPASCGRPAASSGDDGIVVARRACSLCRVASTTGANPHQEHFQTAKCNQNLLRTLVVIT